MVRLWGVWGIASVQGAADMLVMLLAVPIAVRVSRDIRRREASRGEKYPRCKFFRANGCLCLTFSFGAVYFLAETQW